MAAYEFSKLAHGNYSTVTETNLGDVPLDAKDGDGSDPNSKSTIMVRVGMQLMGNAFVHEREVCCTRHWIHFK
jgi:hypothetical protein